MHGASRHGGGGIARGAGAGRAIMAARGADTRGGAHGGRSRAGHRCCRGRPAAPHVRRAASAMSAAFARFRGCRTDESRDGDDCDGYGGEIGARAKHRSTPGTPPNPTTRGQRICCARGMAAPATGVRGYGRRHGYLADAPTPEDQAGRVTIARPKVESLAATPRPKRRNADGRAGRVSGAYQCASYQDASV